MTRDEFPMSVNTVYNENHGIYINYKLCPFNRNDQNLEFTYS